jgi:N-carbamoyl-L-amino-acid hydrolase
VYAALETGGGRAADHAPDRPVTVVSFTEEDGVTFGGGDGLLGSSVATGTTASETPRARSEATGRTLGDTRPDRRRRRPSSPERRVGFLELHTEQNTTLGWTGADVGVVTTITGITRCEATVAGEADHAGATADARTDALAAAATS